MSSPIPPRSTASEIARRTPTARHQQTASRRGNCFSVLSNVLGALAAPVKAVVYGAVDVASYAIQNFNEFADATSILDPEEFGLEPAGPHVPFAEVQKQRRAFMDKRLSKVLPNPSAKTFGKVASAVDRCRRGCKIGTKGLSADKAREVYYRQGSVAAAGAALVFGGTPLVVTAPLCLAALGTASYLCDTPETHASSVIKQLDRALELQMEGVSADQQEPQIANFLIATFGISGEVASTIVSRVTDHSIAGIKKLVLRSMLSTIREPSTKKEVTALLDQLRGERYAAVYRGLTHSLKIGHGIDMVAGTVVTAALLKGILLAANMGLISTGILSDQTSLEAIITGVLQVGNIPINAAKAACLNPSIDQKVFYFVSGFLSRQGINLAAKHFSKIPAIASDLRRLHAEGAHEIQNIEQALSNLRTLLNYKRESTPTGAAARAGAGYGATHDTDEDEDIAEEPTFRDALLSVVSRAIAGTDLTAPSSPMMQRITEKLLGSSDLILNLLVGYSSEYARTAAQALGKDADISFLASLPSLIRVMKATKDAQHLKAAGHDHTVATADTLVGQVMQLDDLDALQEQSRRVFEIIVQTFVQSLKGEIGAIFTEAQVDVAAFFDGAAAGLEAIGDRALVTVEQDKLQALSYFSTSLQGVLGVAIDLFQSPTVATSYALNIILAGLARETSRAILPPPSSAGAAGSASISMQGILAEALGLRYLSQTLETVEGSQEEAITHITLIINSLDEETIAICEELHQSYLDNPEVGIAAIMTAAQEEEHPDLFLRNVLAYIAEKDFTLHVDLSEVDPSIFSTRQYLSNLFYGAADSAVTLTAQVRSCGEQYPERLSTFDDLMKHVLGYDMEFTRIQNDLTQISHVAITANQRAQSALRILSHYAPHYAATATAEPDEGTAAAAAPASFSNLFGLWG